MDRSPFSWPYRPARVAPSVDSGQSPYCPPGNPCLTPGCGNTWCHAKRSVAELPVLEAEAERRDAVATNHRLIGVSIGTRLHPTGVVIAHVDRDRLRVEKTTTIKPGTRYVKIAKHLRRTIEACQVRSRTTTIMDVTGIGEALVASITTVLPGRKIRVAVGPTIDGVRRISRMSVVAGIGAGLEGGKLQLPDDQSLLDALDDYQDDVTATRTDDEIWRTDGDALPLALGLCVWGWMKARPWSAAWRQIPGSRLTTW